MITLMSAMTLFGILDMVADMEFDGGKSLRQQRAILRAPHVEDENLVVMIAPSQLAPIHLPSMSPCLSTYCRNQTV